MKQTKYFLAGLLIFLLFVLNSFGQNTEQFLIGSAGNFYNTESLNISWSLGEVVISTYDIENKKVTQGFHQPIVKKELVLEDYEFFNGFSPNNDQINDYWRIPFLILFPINKVVILNRWGNIVWQTINYNNCTVKFEGKNLYNDDLPDGTYYYIIQYERQEKSGWLFIKR